MLSTRNGPHRQALPTAQGCELGEPCGMSCAEPAGAPTRWACRRKLPARGPSSRRQARGRHTPRTEGSVSRGASGPRLCRASDVWPCRPHRLNSGHWHTDLRVPGASGSDCKVQSDARPQRSLRAWTPGRSDGHASGSPSPFLPELAEAGRPAGSSKTARISETR